MCAAYYCNINPIIKKNTFELRKFDLESDLVNIGYECVHTNCLFILNCPALSLGDWQLRLNVESLETPSPEPKRRSVELKSF
jgi:hypothetical protein